jgi:hypothetical protein
MSQADFGKVIDKPQSVVSRLEDPSYGKMTLNSLLDIAAKVDRALVVQFMDWKSFLKITEDHSEQSSAPSAYNQEELDLFAQQEAFAEAEGDTSVIRHKYSNAIFTLNVGEIPDILGTTAGISNTIITAAETILGTVTGITGIASTNTWSSFVNTKPQYTLPQGSIQPSLRGTIPRVAPDPSQLAATTIDALVQKAPTYSLPLNLEDVLAIESSDSSMNDEKFPVVRPPINPSNQRPRYLS